MSVTVSHSGDFSSISKYLSNLSKHSAEKILRKYGDAGVRALQVNTPIDTGITALSWYYEIENTKRGPSLVFKNSNVAHGKGYDVNVAILIQYGHGKHNGVWVSGVDYINPALKPIFEQIVDDVRKEVSE